MVLLRETLAEGITAMLTEAHLPDSYWGYALATMVHIHNRSPTSALTTMTPYECIYGHKPNVSHLRIFGCLAYANVQKDKRRACSLILRSVSLLATLVSTRVGNSLTYRPGRN